MRYSVQEKNLKLYLFCLFFIACVVGGAICVSAGVSRLCNDGVREIHSLLSCGGIISVLAVAGLLITKPKKDSFKTLRPGVREVFAIMTMYWIAASVLGAIPYITVSGFLWDDALFESFSAFTTTSASLITNGMAVRNGNLPNGVGDLPRGLLFWRCLSSWLGGMGAIALVLSIMPLIRQKNQIIPYAETAGLKSGEYNLSMRMNTSAWNIIGVYALLTLLETLILYLPSWSEIGFFDALCSAFNTVSTSGFCTKQDGISGFSSAWLEAVTLVFMFLSALNFNVAVAAFNTIWNYLRRGRRAVGEKPKFLLFNDESNFFISMILLVTAIMVFLQPVQKIFMKEEYHLHEFLENCWYTLFHTVSFATTTGYSNLPNGYAWMLPAYAVILLLVLSLFGGCSGSTSSGLKSFRVLVLFRQGKNELNRFLYPHMVPTVYLDGKRREDGTMQNIQAFCALFMGVLIFFSITVPLVEPDLDFVQSFETSLSCLTNTGTLFRPDGTVLALGELNLNWGAKLILSLEMLLGRLELYGVLVFLLTISRRK